MRCFCKRLAMDSLLTEEVLSSDVVCLFGFSEEELDLFCDKKVIVFSEQEPFDIYFDGISCDLSSFSHICKEQIFQKFSYLLHPKFMGEEKERMQEWIRRIQTVEWQVQLSFCEYEDFRITVYNNLISSLDEKVDRTSFEEMKGLLQGVPAFICGAGPSLQKDLIHLNGQKGIVFAGGAALSCIENVHIAAGVDPSPCHERATMKTKGVPFFYQPRFDASLLAKMEGPKFEVASNPGYLLENWLEGKEPFDGGWTVTTFCTALALHMGCNPIIFVGMDLAYGDDGSIYSQSVANPKEGKGITWEGNRQTQKDWVLASSWIEQKAAAYPDRTFYTTSQEGLKMKGVIVTKLEELRLSEIDVFSCLDKIKKNFSSSFIDAEKVLLLQNSIELSLYKVGRLLSLWERYYPEDPSSKGEFVLELVELEEQIAYTLIVAPVWDVWQYPIQRQGCRPGTEGIRQLLFFKEILEQYRKKGLWKSA